MTSSSELPIRFERMSFPISTKLEQFQHTARGWNYGRIDRGGEGRRPMSFVSIPVTLAV